MSAKIEVGLLGLGRLGRRYAEILARQIPETRLVAVADTASGRAEMVASELGIDRWHDDPYEFIDSKLDALVIATPTSSHCELVSAAADRRHNIFCEKPISISLAEAESAKKSIERNGVFFQMGFMRRFDPGYSDAHARVTRGEIGDPVLFKSTSRDPYPPSLEYANPQKSGGLILDMGIHDFDLARWFMGEVKTTSAVGAALVYPDIAEAGDIDNALITLEFPRGAFGQIDLTRNGIYGYDISTEILGTEGTIRIGYLRETPVLVMKSNKITHDTVPYFHERFGEAFVRQLRNFAQNVLSEKEAPITIEDGIEALRIGVCATKATRTGVREKVSETGPTD